MLEDMGSILGSGTGCYIDHLGKTASKYGRPSVQCVTESFPYGIKCAEREAEHSHRSRAEVYKAVTIFAT